MEFQYRAIDESRSRSPAPPPPAPSTPVSGSAESHRGDGPVERVGNSGAAAVDADELRRQEEKARIRERILREEAEHSELELEVRTELLREEMLRRSWPALGRSARGSDTPAVLSSGTITAANSSLPVALQAHPKSNALATKPTKRKSLGCATGALRVPSIKKQKRTLTCMVCCITANSEKAMQDHLNGKAHKRKVVAVPELPKQVQETEQERGLEAGEEEVTMETLGDYKSTKIIMATTAGELNEVTQMDGYLLCELCNARTADRVTMMCHLQGTKHKSNAQKKRQPSSKPSGEAVNAATSAIGSADSKKLVLEDFSVLLPDKVRRLEGFLLCELCDAKATSMQGMRQHLSGKKHKNKVNASSHASVNMSTCGKEAAQARLINTDMTVTSDMAAEVEAPLEKSLQPKLGDDAELQEMTVVAPPQEDVAAMDSAKTAGTEMMKGNAISVGAHLKNVSESDSLTMDVDNVMHPLSRVDGFLVCLSCNVKAPSETTMQSHLSGKKHKRVMTLAARGKNQLSVLATGADVLQDNSSKSTKANVEVGLVPLVVPQENTVADEEESGSIQVLATPQTKNIVALAQASMAVDGPADAQPDTCIVEPAEDCKVTDEAEGEHPTAGSNGSVTQTKESAVSTNDTTAPGKPMNIQVEGKVFTVTRQENGSLSCEVCDIHGCDKDNMIQHLYTRTHWGKASLAEKKEKEQACMTAVAIVDKDGEVGSMAS